VSKQDKFVLLFGLTNSRFHAERNQYFLFYFTAGGGQWKNASQETQAAAPPPPLAADVTMSALTCQLAAENLCVAASQLLSQIRTLRLSILLMDESTIAAEEEWQVHQALELASEHVEKAAQLEQEWINLRAAPFDDDE
jgi:hypothetical protein